jgi:Protein of unknown function (DUF3618)
MTANSSAGKAGRPAKGPQAAPAAGVDIPDDPQALAEDIKQTREQVGQTIETLTNKLDPKVQLRETAERMKGRVSATTGEVTSKLTDKAGTVGQQVRTTAAKAARGADEQRVPLAVAAGVAVLLVGAWITWVMRRR